MKKINLGVIVSTHIDLPILVPDKTDITKLQVWEIKSRLSIGKYKCSYEDLELTIQELFEGAEVNPGSVLNYSYDLNAHSLKFKKIDYIMDDLGGRTIYFK